MPTDIIPTVSVFQDRRLTTIKPGCIVSVPDLHKDHGRGKGRQGFVMGFELQDSCQKPILVFFGPKDQMPSLEQYVMNPEGYAVECLAPNEIRVEPNR